MRNRDYEKLDDIHVRNKLCNRFNMNWVLLASLSIVVFVIGCIIGRFVNIQKCEPESDFENYNFELISKTLQQRVNVDFMLEQLKIFASEIHQAGSNRNLYLADYMRDNWKQWGLKSSEIFKYKINKTVTNDSNPSIVRILLNDKVVDNLITVEMNDSLPIYHSYSIGGHARGKFVFINYGLSKDLKILDNLNISYCGSNIIPIARLGFSVRSAKVKNIMKKCGNHLPGGILIYPDPWDFSVDPNNKSSTPDNTPVYPNSWWLPGDAAVFGNMKMLSDLQNPGLPTLSGIFETVNFSSLQTPLPVQPISYNDAVKLFNYLDKSPVPDSFDKCLPHYLQSTNNVEVEMTITNEVAPAIMANVVGWIPGVVDQDRYVILGNHRDAWVTGASDPVSGTVILQQVVRVLSEAYRNGLFRPYRSIMFTNWDGEEEGLIGSTEFTNQFSSDLLDRCVAYVNMDCPIKGTWSFNGRATPLMIGPMLESAKHVWIDPSTSLFMDWVSKKPQLPNRTEPRVDFLGGGSDHISFAYVLGIPSAYPEYKYNQSLANMPAYHTRYDDINMMLKWIDPHLQHHKIVSQFVLDYIIRLSYSPLIPYSIDRLVDLVLTSFPALKKDIDSIPIIKDSNYSEILYGQLLNFKEASLSFQSHIKSDKTILTNKFKLRKVNDILLHLPRMFVTRDGLPTRPYLRNILLSTKLKNSYEGSVFTGVYDAIDLFREGKIDLTTVLHQLSLLSNCFRRATDLFKGGIISIFD